MFCGQNGFFISTTQVRFDLKVVLKFCVHFDYWNQFWWIVSCAPFIGSDANQHQFQFYFFQFFSEFCYFFTFDSEPLRPQKIERCMHFIYWVTFLAPAALMTSTASTVSVASMISTAKFHQKTYWTTYPSLSMWKGSSKIPYFIDFWHLFY